MEVKFNVNQEVKVKLTEMGYGLLLERYNKFASNFPEYPKKTINDLKAEADG